MKFRVLAKVQVYESRYKKVAKVYVKTLPGSLGVFIILHSQKHMMLDVLESWDCFSQHVCTLLTCVNIFHPDLPSGHTFPNKVVLNANMFCLGVENRVFSHLKRILIITKKCCRLIVCECRNYFYILAMNIYCRQPTRIKFLN
jgi:hypothetical protein